MKKAEWGYKSDGTPRRFGDLTKAEKDAVVAPIVKQVQDELNDPRSPLRRAARAIMES